MTIAVYTPATYAANVGTSAFVIPWAYQSKTHVKPYLDGVLLTSGFVVSDPDPTGVVVGGNVVFSPAPVGTLITFIREVPLDQPTDFQNQGSFKGKRHEDAYDREVMLSAMLDERLDRAVVAKVGEVGQVLPTPVNNYVLGWSSGALVNIQSIPTGSVSAAMVPVVQATTLPLARTALGLGELAVLNTVSVTQVIDTVAQLKLLAAPSSAVTYFVRGYYAVGDAGGGVFRWLAGDTTTDNGGTVLQLTAGGTGRWLRVYDGPIYARWFGAKGDNSTDDTTSVQAALNLGRDVVFSDGTFITGALTLSTANQKLTGIKATLKHRAGAMLAWMIKVNAAGIVIRNLTLDGNSANVTGALVFSESCIFIDQAGQNFWLIENTFVNWKSLSVFMNGGVPSNNPEKGFVCRGNLFNINLEIAMYLWIGPESCIITGNRFIEQYKGAIRLYDQYAKKVVISSNIIEYTSGSALTGSPLAIELNSLASYSVAAEGAGEGCDVTGNVIVGSQAGGSQLWGISLDGCARFVCANNTVRTNLLWGIEIVRGYGVVTGNVIENVTGAAASSAAGIILNGCEGHCVVSGNLIKNVTLNGGVVLFGTTVYCHVINGNTFENCKFQIVSNHSGSSNIQNNVFVGGANTNVPATVVTCGAQQDEINFSNNTCLFKNLGSGFVQSIVGNRWLVHGNRFEGGAVVADCLSVAATYSRNSIQGNRIRNYNAKPINTSASAGKNVCIGNTFETFGVASTFAGTDTNVNNIDVT